jgi:hypothetical protein
MCLLINPTSHSSLLVVVIISNQIKVINKGHVEVYRTSVDELLQFHQLKRNLNHFDKFYLKARKFCIFSMHECNAHFYFLSISSLKFWDVTNALLENHTWQLVPRHSNTNIVSGKWDFRQKFHSNGSLACYKARWVCCGYSQQEGLDYDETFSPVCKPNTIHAVLSIVVSSHWPIHQLDVKNAFLHGPLQETVYCQ